MNKHFWKEFVLLIVITTGSVLAAVYVAFILATGVNV